MARLAKISFVLCVKNGGDRLTQCLESMEAQDWDGQLEILLVDNSSTDDTHARFVAFGNASRHSVKVLTTTIPGNGAGRNTAIAHATGELVIFIDGDCYPDGTCVRAWDTIFGDNPDLGFASGRILRFDPLQSSLGCIDSLDTRLTAPHAFIERGFIQGSNMAFRRSCLLESGPFDVRFGAGTRFAGEEWELALRSSQAGWTGGYFPGPVVLHDHRRYGAEERGRMLFYDYGAGAVYAKRATSGDFLKAILWLARDVKRSKDLVQAGCVLRGALDYLLQSAKQVDHVSEP